MVTRLRTYERHVNVSTEILTKVKKLFHISLYIITVMTTL